MRNERVLEERSTLSLLLHLRAVEIENALASRSRDGGNRFAARAAAFRLDARELARIDLRTTRCDLRDRLLARQLIARDARARKRDEQCADERNTSHSTSPQAQTHGLPPTNASRSPIAHARMLGDACLVVVSPRAIALAGALCLLATTTRAEAFTALFATSNDKTTQVTEHRIAVAVLPGEVVLWDQAQWSTSSTSTELAWVAPVPRTATSTAVTSDAWFAALDASTQPIIYQPPDFGPAAGCSLTGGARFLGGCASDSAYGRGPDKIPIHSSAVAGPVETVNVTGANLTSWLTTNNFAIGPSDSAAITEVANAGFDFVVMRLRPNCGENSTRVFRVSLPTTTTTIPTRMMSIGGSRTMDITLYTIADRRQTVLGSANSSINLRELLWDERENKSNYAELRDKALSGNSGRSWLTEYADIPDRTTSSSASSSSSSTRSSSSRVTPSFFEIYPGICGSGVLPSNTQLITPSNVRPGPCNSPTPSPRDSGSDGAIAIKDATTDAPPSDASSDASDASIDASVALDGGDSGIDDDDDAGADAGPSFPPAARDTCASPDDLSVGVRGLDLNRVFLTRLRGTFLTFTSGDIAIAPDSSGGTVTNGLQAVAFEDDKNDKPNRSAACDSVSTSRTNVVAPLIALSVITIAISRRRRRR
jgi:hypothetical protein